MYIQIDVTIQQKFEENLFDFADQLGISCFSSPLLIDNNEGNEEKVIYSGLSIVSFILYFLENDNHNTISNTNQIPPLAQVSEFVNTLKTFCNQKSIQIINLSQKSYSDNTDWMENFKSTFKPLEVTNSIIIIPPWCIDKFKKNSYSNKTIIVIEPGMAFGTGTHETTKLCLKILENIRCKDKLCLDIGTGSGILAFYLLLLGANKVIAIEKDTIATQNFLINAQYNNIPNHKFQLICTDFENFDLNYPYQLQNAFQTENQNLVNYNKFDIIVANLTSDLIIQFLPKIYKFANTNADIIISGINTTNSKQVILHIETNNLVIINHLYENDWHALHLRKKFS